MKIREHFKKMIKDKMIVIECGAGDGRDSRWMVEDLVKFKINFKFYAIEPDIRTNEAFWKNVKNNKNVKRINAVIGNVDGVVKFWLSDGIYPKYNTRFLHQSSIRKPNDTMMKKLPTIKFKEMNINSVSLDAFCILNKINMIDFLWADIQGAEKNLIEGGVNMFNNKVRYFYTEYENNPVYDGAIGMNELLKLLPNYEAVENYHTDILLKIK